MIKSSRLITCLTCLLPVSLVNADDVADLAGDWVDHTLETPSYLAETYYNIFTDQIRFSDGPYDHAQEGEQIVDTYFPSPFEASQSPLLVTTSGTYTGSDYTGQILDFNRGRILTKDSDEALADSVPLFVSTTKDLLVTSVTDPDNLELAILVREPASLSLADVNGDWTIGTAYIPTILMESYWNGSSGRDAPNSESANEGEMLVNVYRPDDFESFWGSIGISNGSFSGLFSGSIATQGTQLVITPDDPDSSPFTFSINESKDVMVTTQNQNDESMEMIILARKPSSLSLADLEGTWRVASLIIPINLQLAYYNSDTDTSVTVGVNQSVGANFQFVDLFYTSEFESEKGNLEVDASGNVSGIIRGTFSVNGDKTLTFNDSEDGPAPVFINASKNFAYNFSIDAESLNIHVLTKVSTRIPDTFEEKVDLRLVEVDGQTVFTLNGSDDLKVVTSSTLDGSPSTWSETTNSEGTSLIAPGKSGNSAEFYSVTPRPDDPE